jgi:hypothetical protein
MQRTLSVLWNGGESMNPSFQLLFSLLINFFGIRGSQIEIKRIFSLAKILMNLKDVG